MRREDDQIVGENAGPDDGCKLEDRVNSCESFRQEGDIRPKYLLAQVSPFLQTVSTSTKRHTAPNAHQSQG
jgi:hypothetical protein